MGISTLCSIYLPASIYVVYETTGKETIKVFNLQAVVAFHQVIAERFEKKHPNYSKICLLYFARFVLFFIGYLNASPIEQP